MYITLIIVLLVVVLPLLVLWSIYNKLAKKRNQIENSISTTDALFLKRGDLIPSLIAVAQQYANFEQETLEKVTALRGMNSHTPPAQLKQAELSFMKMMATMEQYPKLAANEQFLNLQYNISEVEEQISAGRRYISASITDYNDSVRLFPSNVVAKITGFTPYEWQYATQQQRQNVDATELFKKNKATTHNESVVSEVPSDEPSVTIEYIDEGKDKGDHLPTIR